MKVRRHHNNKGSRQIKRGEVHFGRLASPGEEERDIVPAEPPRRSRARVRQARMDARAEQKDAK